MNDQGGASAQAAPCPQCGASAFLAGFCTSCGYLAFGGDTPLSDADPMTEVVRHPPSARPVDTSAADAADASDIGVLQGFEPTAFETPTEVAAGVTYARCPRCGSEAGAARRCAQCGFPLRFERRRNADDAARRCRACGVRNSPSETICINCGSRLVEG